MIDIRSHADWFEAHAEWKALISILNPIEREESQRLKDLIDAMTEYNKQYCARNKE